MIQITAQMRVLVAIEPVDGRKYAPSIDMRRLVKTGRAEVHAGLIGNHRPGVPDSA